MVTLDSIVNLNPAELSGILTSLKDGLNHHPSYVAIIDEAIKNYSEKEYSASAKHLRQLHYQMPDSLGLVIATAAAHQLAKEHDNSAKFYQKAAIMMGNNMPFLRTSYLQRAKIQEIYSTPLQFQNLILPENQREQDPDSEGITFP